MQHGPLGTSRTAWSDFRGAAGWLQGPRGTPQAQPHSLTGLQPHLGSLCLASVPSQGQAPQSSQDRTHRKQQRQGHYERRFLKSYLTLPLTAVIRPLDVAIVFAEGTSPATRPVHANRDGQRCDPCPHSRLVGQGVHPQPRLNRCE